MQSKYQSQCCRVPKMKVSVSDSFWKKWSTVWANISPLSHPTKRQTKHGLELAWMDWTEYFFPFSNQRCFNDLMALSVQAFTFQNTLPQTKTSTLEYFTLHFHGLIRSKTKMWFFCSDMNEMKFQCLSAFVKTNTKPLKHCRYEITEPVCVAINVTKR